MLVSTLPPNFHSKRHFKKSYVPSDVINAVFSMASSATGICQYLLLRLILE